MKPRAYGGSFYPCCGPIRNACFNSTRGFYSGLTSGGVRRAACSTPTSSRALARGASGTTARLGLALGWLRITAWHLCLLSGRGLYSRRGLLGWSRNGLARRWKAANDRAHNGPRYCEDAGKCCSPQHVWKIDLRLIFREAILELTLDNKKLGRIFFAGGQQLREIDERHVPQLLRGRNAMEPASEGLFFLG